MNDVVWVALISAGGAVIAAHPREGMTRAI